jgi:serpin B
MSANQPARRTLLLAFALGGLGLQASACSSTRDVPAPGRDDAIVGNGDEARVEVQRASLGTDLAAPGALVAAFAGKLLSQVAPAAGTNLIYSPWSIVAALAMNRAGAVGTTRTQIDTALGVDPKAAPRAFDAVVNTGGLLLEKRNRTVEQGARKGDVILRSANTTWAARDIAWQRPFLETLATYHGSGVRLTDFAADPGAARIAINTWVADHTEHKIT